MKLKIEKGELQKKVALASSAISQKVSMPILTKMVIVAENDEISLHGTDLSMGVVASVDGEVLEGGRIAVESKVFTDVVKKMPEGTLTVKTDEDGNVVVSNGKVRLKLSCADAENYPYMEFHDMETVALVKECELKNALKSVLFSLATDASDKKMTGAHLVIQDKDLTLTCLDGHRIAIFKLAMEQPVAQMIDCIVPGLFLGKLQSMLSTKEEPVAISIGNTHIQFKINGAVFTSRLIEGSYYNVGQMIAVDAKIRMRINKTDFLDAVDRASLFVNEGDNKPVILDITDTLRISIKAACGQMEEVVDAEKEGDEKPLRIGFNPRFILESVGKIDDEDISIEVSGPKTPCVIRGEEYLYLVLPVNIH